MPDEPRVQELLSELIDREATPEEVCGACPELLPVVRERWRQICRARTELDALLPIGLGLRSAEFDEAFMDTFQLVVLRGQKPHAVLDFEAGRLNQLMIETGAPCWQPDPPSTGACQVQ